MTDTLQFPTPRLASPPPFRVLLGRVGTRGRHVPMSLVYYDGCYYARVEGGARIGIRPECVVAWRVASRHARREQPRAVFLSVLRWLNERDVPPWRTYELHAKA